MEAAKDIESVNTARDYRTNKEIVNKVNSLASSSKKEELEKILTEVAVILDDMTAPAITGIANDSYTNQNVSLNVSEENVKVFVNGVEETLAELKNISEEKNYTVEVVDQAFNSTSITFVIDKTAPVITVADLKENFTKNGNITVTDANVFDIVIARGEVKETVTAKLVEDKYVANIELETNGTYTITATDKAKNSVAKTILYDENGALVNNEDELRSALEDANIQTIYLNKDIEELKERIIINRPVTINGNDKKLTFTTDINTAPYGERQGVVVTSNDVVINDLTVQMNAVEGNDTWTGTYAIQVYNGSATLNNIIATKADGGIFANNSTIKLTGTIDVSGNEFGGIEVSNGSPVLDATVATLVNTTEAFKKPTIWTDKTINAVVNVSGLTAVDNIKEEQVQYYLNKENIATGTITANINEILVSNNLDKPNAIISNGEATLITYKDATNVRFRVTNVVKPEGANVKVWAMDTVGNVWDMVTEGWGPAEGFSAPAKYSATTPFQIVADKTGEYKATIELYEVNGNVLASYDIQFEVINSINIDGVDYSFETYNELFAKLPANTKASIELSEDINESLVIPENIEIVLNLNGNTITGNKAITNNGTLSIINGKISTPNNAIVNTGTIKEITNVEVSSDWTGINNSGTIEKIENSKIEARMYPIYQENGSIGELANNEIIGHYITAIYLAETSTITKITSGSYITYGDKPDQGNSVAGFGLYVGSKSVVEEIAGGTFQGNKSAVANYGTINKISGGEFLEKMQNDVWAYSSTFLYSGKVLSITGGRFYSYNGNTTNGIFAGKGTLAEGYEFIETSDNYFEVKKQN